MPDSCIGCIVMGGTPVVIKVGCPVHDPEEGKEEANV